MNKSYIRRAITVIKNAGLVQMQGFNNDDFMKDKVTIVLNVDNDLVVTEAELKKIKSKANQIKLNYE